MIAYEDIALHTILCWKPITGRSGHSDVRFVDDAHLCILEGSTQWSSTDGRDKCRTNICLSFLM